MKNEALVRAITGIDDELIVSAHRRGYSKRKGIKYFSTYAAACLVIVCGMIFLLHHNSEPEISFGGTVVSTQPVSVTSSDTRQTILDVITVPFDIISNGDLRIKAIDGTLAVYSSKTNEQICVGQVCEAKGSVTVEWTIENPDHGQTYQIDINNQETMLILQYEQATNQWTIIRSED